MPGLDLHQIAKIFTRRGERVVIILPAGEPVVLLPLSEYEKMKAGHQNTTPVQPKAHDKPAPKVPAAPPPPKALEAIDPPQGGLKDDDQYYPEPLEG